MDTAIAEETRKSVQAEEIKANEKASKAQAIADDAQKDLDEALPALDAALASLRNLNKNDVTEVGSCPSSHTHCHVSFWCPLRAYGVPKPTPCTSFGNCVPIGKGRMRSRYYVLVPLAMCHPQSVPRLQDLWQ